MHTVCFMPFVGHSFSVVHRLASSVYSVIITRVGKGSDGVVALRIGRGKGMKWNKMGRTIGMGMGRNVGIGVGKKGYSTN